MAVARYLVDKSAMARLNRDPVFERLDPLVDAGLTAVCGMVVLEVLYSGRNAKDVERIKTDMVAHEWLHTDDDDFVRATDVFDELARTGRHRAVSPPDLVIAAVAERHQVAVRHYDSDFDLIAEVTGQPAEWIVPRGSVN